MFNLKPTARIAHAALAVLLIGSMITPAFAAKNDHRFAKSIEGNKLTGDASECRGLKSDLDKAEREANKRGGTKAAKAWADRADTIWQSGVNAGCGWAQLEVTGAGGANATMMVTESMGSSSGGGSEGGSSGGGSGNHTDGTFNSSMGGASMSTGDNGGGGIIQ